MKILIMGLLLALLLASSARAQDSTRLERMTYVTGATLAYSLIDYIGFNVLLKNLQLPAWYRPVSFVLHAVISYLLYEKFGLTSAISFNLIWWTWGEDLGFYGWLNAFNEGGAWGGRTRNELYDNHISWAGWTPIGLLRPQGSIIARDALYGQVAVGFSIAMGILW